MTQFLLALLLVGLAMLGLAVGTLAGRRCLRGGCRAGAAAGRDGSCPTCGRGSAAKAAGGEERG